MPSWLQPRPTTALNAFSALFALIWLIASPQFIVDHALKSNVNSFQVQAQQQQALQPANTGRNFVRIVSLSTISDQILYELCAPDRIAAFSRDADHLARAQRFSGKKKIARDASLEHLLALKPDLIFATSGLPSKRRARLKKLGIIVIDLGEMRGLETLIAAIRIIGNQIGRPEQAARFAATFERRMNRIAGDSHSPLAQKRALYLSIYGDKVIGGTRRTSYHDVLTHAGLIDAAATNFIGWPTYSSEHLLSLDPDLIVTRRGMGQSLCRHSGLRRTRACQTPGAIIEIESYLLNDPGLGMLEASETLYRVLQ